MTTAVNNAQYTTNMTRSSQLRKSKYDIKGRLEAIFLTFILLLSWHRVAWWWKAKFDEYVKGSTDCSLRRNDQFLIFSTERQARCAWNKNSNLARPCMMMAKWFYWSNLLLMNIHTVPRQRSTHSSFNGNCTFFAWFTVGNECKFLWFFSSAEGTGRISLKFNFHFQHFEVLDKSQFAQNHALVSKLRLNGNEIVRMSMWILYELEGRSVWITGRN